METLVTANDSNKMSSLEIAKLTGKNHAHVMRDLRDIEPTYNEVFGGQSRFGQSSYLNSQNKIQPCYDLTKSQTLFLLTGYSPILRAKVQKRWEELEQQFTVPTTFREALLLAADQQEVIEKQNTLLLEQEPNVMFAKTVQGSDDSILIRDLAKLISQSGYKIGQNKLFFYLKDNNYLCKTGGMKNMPTQKSMNLEIMEVKETTIVKPNGKVKLTMTTKITGKGQKYFINKFLKVR